MIKSSSTDTKRTQKNVTSPHSRAGRSPSTNCWLPPTSTSRYPAPYMETVEIIVSVCCSEEMRAGRWWTSMPKGRSSVLTRRPLFYDCRKSTISTRVASGRGGSCICTLHRSSCRLESSSHDAGWPKLVLVGYSWPTRCQLSGKHPLESNPWPPLLKGILLQKSQKCP